MWSSTNEIGAAYEGGEGAQRVWRHCWSTRLVPGGLSPPNRVDNRDAVAHTAPSTATEKRFFSFRGDDSSH